jgi:hypothetical protein
MIVQDQESMTQTKRTLGDQTQRKWRLEEDHRLRNIMIFQDQGLIKTISKAHQRAILDP